MAQKTLNEIGLSSKYNQERSSFNNIQQLRVEENKQIQLEQDEDNSFEFYLYQKLSAEK